MNRFAQMVIVLISLSVSSMAQTGDGGYAGAFLRLGLGARAKSLGDAGTALARGGTAGFYNPAALPFLPHRQAVVSFAFLPLDRSLDVICYAQSLQPKAPESADDEQPLRAGFALGWVHAGVDGIDGRDSAGRSIGSFSNSEHAFYLSFALSPSPMLAIGLSGKVLYNRFPTIGQDDEAITSTGFGLDFGLYLTPMKNLSFGLVLRDQLSKYTWNTDKLWERGTSTTYRFPRTLRAGLAYRPPLRWLLLVGELEDSPEQNPRYHLGAEVELAQVGALRLGLDDGAPAFGFGFDIELFGHRAGLNYAFIHTGVAPSADHIFSWTFDLDRR